MQHNPQTRIGFYDTHIRFYSLQNSLGQIPRKQFLKVNNELLAEYSPELTPVLHSEGHLPMYYLPIL
jgi:hypothetical protein